MDTISPSKSDTVLNLTRVFDAAPERVFEAWLDGAQLSKWLGPRNMGACPESVELDPRTGGKYRIVMNTPKGQTVVGGVYREIVRHSRLVFTWMWEGSGDCSGKTAAVNPAPGCETLVTVSFRPVGKGTEMTFRHENFADTDQRDRHNNGWTISFDQLAELLAAK